MGRGGGRWAGEEADDIPPAPRGLYLDNGAGARWRYAYTNCKPIEVQVNVPRRCDGSGDHT